MIRPMPSLPLTMCKFRR